MSRPNGKSGGVQRLDYSEAEQMLRAGKTQSEVAEHFGVSQAAVSVAIARGNIKFDTGFKRRLPWTIKKEHSNLAIPRALRLALRLLDGEELSPAMRKTAQGFLNKLEELDAVIHYDPDVEPFFFRVPRRSEIDHSLFREPDDPGQSPGSS